MIIYVVSEKTEANATGIKIRCNFKVILDLTLVLKIFFSPSSTTVS